MSLEHFESNIQKDLRSLTPADLASEFATDLVLNGTLDGDRRADGIKTINTLQQMAESPELGLVGTEYIVRSRRSTLLPARLEPGKDVHIIDFSDLEFEGTFSEYAIVRLRGEMGQSALRAFCMEFTNVTLLPGCDRVTDEMTMFVPVKAAIEMDPLAA